VLGLGATAFIVLGAIYVVLLIAVVLYFTRGD
jgi:hypothetical protein